MLVTCYRYNSAEEKEELLEESGWKLVHADVLRTPPQSTLLATSIGTGMQVPAALKTSPEMPWHETHPAADVSDLV